jgi:LacI family transcriptional regulator
VLVSPVHDLTRLRRMQERGTEVVLVDQKSRTADTCSVSVDDVNGARLAVRHLLALGHRRVAFVNGPTSIRQCADRRRGVRQEVRSAGLDVDIAVFEVACHALDVRAGEEAAAKALAARPAPTAVFCNNDLMAIGVLRALQRAKVAVPAEMAVVGYDDIDLAALWPVPLTSVRQPRYQLGYVAVQLLLAEAADGSGHEHRQIVFQPELAVRESSDAAATA